MASESTLFLDVRRLQSKELTARVDHLAARERQLVCDFLVHLAELDRRELHLEPGDHDRAELVFPVPARKRSPQPTVTPVSADEHVLRMTVGPEFKQELDAVKQALSHKVPSGRLEEVLRECFRITLALHDKRKRGSSRPRKTSQTAAASSDKPAASRHVPIAVQREVRDRDGGACVFVGTSGKRCGSKHQVEPHHVVPFARGGTATVDNLELRCRPHNQYEARLAFGPEHMARFQRGDLDPPAPC
jgi:hypothetical protein